MKKSADNSEKKEQNNYRILKQEKVMIIILSIIIILFMFCELYLILYYKSQYFWIGISTFVVIVLIYALLSTILNKVDRVEKSRDIQYESLYKSEKASYFLAKKNYQELENKIIKMEKKLVLPSTEIPEVQKNIAKLIIAKNAENLKILQKEFFEQIKELDSKLDNLVVRQDDYDTILQNMKDSILTKVELLMDENNKEMSSQLSLINKDLSVKQQQIVERVEILLEKQRDMISNIDQLSITMSEINDSAFNRQISEAKKQNVILENNFEYITKVVEETNNKLEEPIIKEISEELAVEEVKEEIVEESVIQELKEKIAEELVTKELKEEIVKESIKQEIEEKLAEEPVMQELKEEIVEEPIRQELKEEIIEESVTEEMKEEVTKPVLEVDGDPNRQLSPEEIAALFASVN